MRIRKLAKELGTDDASVLGLLRRLGHARYNDGEQQIPADLEAQVRRHARELPKLGTNTLPAPREVPIAAVPPEDTEAALFARAMAAVKPIGPQPKAQAKGSPAKAPPAPRAPAAPAPTVRAPAPPPTAPTPAPTPPSARPAPPSARPAPSMPARAPAPSAHPTPPATAAPAARHAPPPPGKAGAKGVGMVTIKATAARPAPGAPSGEPAPKPPPAPTPGDPFAALAAVREHVPAGAMTPAPAARAGPPSAGTFAATGTGAPTSAASTPPAAPAPARALEWPPRVDRLVADAPAKGPKAAPPKAAPPKAAPSTGTPARHAAPVGSPAASKAAPPKRPPNPELLLAEEQARSAALAEELAAARGQVADAEQQAADAEGRVALAEARIAELEAAVGTLDGRLHEVDQHRRQLQRDLASAGEAPDASTLRACFERRGLLGDDEIAAALRALLDAHRVGELGRIGIANPDQLEDLLWERVLLLAGDDTPPPGVVAVRVPEERSEGRQASVNRAAMSRFSTACLLRNIRRVVIVGGSPAYHRMLKEGLDPRLDLRLIPGNRRGRVPQVPGADLVILWASTILDHSVSAQFPEGVVIPHRGIARMLGAATEWIESRPD